MALMPQLFLIGAIQRSCFLMKAARVPTGAKPKNLVFTLPKDTLITSADKLLTLVKPSI